MTIAGQRNRLTVKLTVSFPARIKTPSFTIQTFPVFDGKLCLCGFSGISRSSSP